MNENDERNNQLYNQKLVTIIVNAKPVQVNENTMLTHKDIVEAAYGEFVDGMTVQYTRGEWPKPSGVLFPNQVIMPVDGIVFDVVNTSKA